MPGMAHVRIQKSTKIHCICNKVMFEKRIICANDCAYESFHLKCVKMKRRPKKQRKWFCNECIDTPAPPSSAPQSSTNHEAGPSSQFPAYQPNWAPMGPPPSNAPPPPSSIWTNTSTAPYSQYSSSHGSDPYVNQQPSISSIPASGNQYGQSLPNHGSGPHSQFPAYQPNWALSDVQGVMHNHGQPNKSTPLPPQQTSIGLPRPLNYFLMQDLQHEESYGFPTPAASQSYDNGGSGMHPHHMGPPHGLMNPPTIINQSSAPQSSNVPPFSQSLNNQNMDNTMSFPAVTGSNNGTPLHDPEEYEMHSPTNWPRTPASPEMVGQSISADDVVGTDPPSSTPQASANVHPMEHEMHSPTNWPRTPASPEMVGQSISADDVVGTDPPSSTPQASANVHPMEHDILSATHCLRTPASPKPNSLCKLYDMDDNQDRREWLNKLLNFMEGRGTPITACPMIKEKPLDLYELYLCVMERAGYIEVCRVPGMKEWKNIAGLLGIGTKKDIYYELRHHYLKYLLAFECYFEQD